MQPLTQANEEEKQYYKAKSYINANTGQGKTSTSKRLDYLDEDETRLEAMGPTRNSRENESKENLQLCYMNFF